MLTKVNKIPQSTTNAMANIYIANLSLALSQENQFILIIDHLVAITYFKVNDSSRAIDGFKSGLDFINKTEQRFAEHFRVFNTSAFQHLINFMICKELAGNKTVKVNTINGSIALKRKQIFTISFSKIRHQSVW